MTSPKELKVGDRVRVKAWTVDGDHHDTEVRKVAFLKKGDRAPCYWIGRDPINIVGAFNRHELRKLPGVQT